MEQEIWKDIVGYNGLYKISNFGKVYSKLRNKELSICKCGRGYDCVYIGGKKNKKMFLIHRLVAQAFIPNPNNKNTVNHINGIKTDNRVENLEWATYSENNYHAIKNGLKTYNKIMKPVFQIKNGVVVNEYCSVANASKQTGINKYCIYDCVKGKTKSAYGFQWKYKDII